ncbi:MAG: prepilin-type N-terminal cleavage/methylation domain-containing protein [Candidatus Omnitrophica bacterium]|nr:prepilin-type N-terminal cleavage/methylation domain-containing protein [Candidatus Omnitrophota bacterium]
MKRGFTLLELLIVIIIVGVLATLALPNFLRGVERARWSEAKSVLGALRGAQIRYKAQYETGYATSINDLDVSITGDTGKHFSFSVSNDANTLATATRSAGDYMGQTISISELGNFTYSAGVPTWLQ